MVSAPAFYKQQALNPPIIYKVWETDKRITKFLLYKKPW
jgi:hypothetical protein